MPVGIFFISLSFLSKSRSIFHYHFLFLASLLFSPSPSFLIRTSLPSLLLRFPPFDIHLFSSSRTDFHCFLPIAISSLTYHPCPLFSSRLRFLPLPRCNLKSVAKATSPFLIPFPLTSSPFSYTSFIADLSLAFHFVSTVKLLSFLVYPSFQPLHPFLSLTLHHAEDTRRVCDFASIAPFCIITKSGTIIHIIVTR